MNAATILHNPRLATLTAAAFVGLAATFLTANAAHADTDITIGVGELHEYSVSKSMDYASPKLTQFAINGNSPAAGGRVDNFEIQHLMSSYPAAHSGKAGNIEFEWKVEEGES